jgi:signal transduction histidine kinase
MASAPTNVDDESAPILLVDDVPANLIALEAILSGPESALVGVRSGAEALAELAAREFAVILLDLQMPIMDGIETALEIRRYGGEAGRLVPIIFLTATEPTVPRVLHAYTSGAVDFIQKPLQPEIIRSKVSVFAALFRARQRLVREIEERRRLEEALRARDELLAIVSHDLKNPLNAILLSATQIEGAAAEHQWERATKAAGAIAGAVDRMSRLVGNLLDLATLDAGEPLSMEKGHHDLAGLTLEVTEILRPLAQAGELTLLTQLDVGMEVLCDRDRIQQVFANLVGNAIKFTGRRGSIVVGARRVGAEFVVSVRDTGVGIRDDQVARIFLPYWKGEVHRKDGAGLGLSIAKAIVEAHEGRIWVETAAGQGSTFFFTLRAADPSQPVLRAVQACSLEGAGD